jgi:hypothetical protein
LAGAPARPGATGADTNAAGSDWPRCQPFMSSGYGLMGSGRAAGGGVLARAGTGGDLETQYQRTS